MITEKTTVGKNTQYPLDAILTLPDDVSGPVPAVVMVHGSGPSDKDERVMKLTPFRDLAEGLAKRGIASLRYDKRTFAYKKQLAKAKDITVREEVIDDALLALDLLKGNARIDASNVWVLGHSMGAMLAPRIDAEWKDAKGAILMAGTPFRLEEVVLRQFQQAGGKGLIGLIMNGQYKKYAAKFERLYEMSDDEAKKEMYAGNLSLYYFKEMGRKTAADYLLESDKPALILQGGRDFQCLEKVDLARFREILADKPNVAFRVYPELNHCFVPALYDDILKAKQEYGVERHIGDEVFDDIAGFIAQNR